TAVAGVPDGRAPDVPVLRKPCGAGLPAVETAVVAGGVLAARTRPPGARTVRCLRLVVAGRRPIADTHRADAVALVAAWRKAGNPFGAVPRHGVAAAGVRAVPRPEHRVRDDRGVLARPRSGACVVRRFLRQRAGGD